MVRYHDEEWGVAVHDDFRHFEYMVLDGAQAGLSWKTVLHKRAGYREAFAGFDPGKVAKFGKRDIERLLKNPKIIRNRLKIESAISNAQRFLKVQEEAGSFDIFIWRFVNGRTIHHGFKTLAELPPRTPESDAMSRELKRRGFKFVGSTICYAYMQAAGLVNDHVVTCFRYKALSRP